MRIESKRHLPAISFALVFFLVAIANPLPLRLMDFRLEDWVLRNSKHTVDWSRVLVLEYTEDDAREYMEPFQAVAYNFSGLKSAAAIGINIQGMPWDEIMLERVRTFGNVIFSVHAAAPSDSQTGQSVERVQLDAAISDHGEPGIPEVAVAIFPYPEYTALAAGAGFNSLTPDEDGVRRRAPMEVSYKDAVFLNFGAQLALKALKIDPRSVKSQRDMLVAGTTIIPLQKHQLILDCPSTWEDVPRISFREFKDVDSSAKSNLVKGKIVILTDARPVKMLRENTPTEAGVDNTMLNALIAVQILSNRHPFRPAEVWAGLVSVLIGIAIYMISLYRPLGGVIIAAGCTGGIIAASIWGRRNGIILPPTLPLVAPIAFWGVAFIQRYIRETAQREKLRSIFARYLSRNVLKRVLEDESLLALGGSRETLTVLFADIRNFTGFAEGHSPDDVVTYLNRFYTTMIETIFAHEGTLDKLMGDGIMVFFGDPVRQPDHAARAIRCAIAMEHAMSALRAEYPSAPAGQLELGIGINTGEVLVGNLGSLDYIDYTVIGDSVNVAARLEKLAKGGEILVADATRRLVTEGGYKFEKLEPVTVKGRKDAVEVNRII